MVNATIMSPTLAKSCEATLCTSWGNFSRFLYPRLSYVRIKEIICGIWSIDYTQVFLGAIKAKIES
jgi:hypothetical protein